MRYLVHREFFASKVISTIADDPRLIGLSHPAELFDSTTGAFLPAPTVVGLLELPTPGELSRRIAAETDPAVQDELRRFSHILIDATAWLSGGLSMMHEDTLQSLATHFAPILRQHRDQRFFPVDPLEWANYDDGVVKASLYESTGRTPLKGRIFELLFDADHMATAGDPEGEPYKSKIPFVSAVGIEPPLLGYPDDALHLGRLDLAAADPRFGPSRMPPTIWAELKPVLGSSLLNREVQEAARTQRYAALRGNRMHHDPLYEVGPLAPMPSSDPAVPNNDLGPDDVPATDPLMLVYHFFYPIDDEARVTGAPEATNREGHHVALGILFLRTNSQFGNDPTHAEPGNPDSGGFLSKLRLRPYALFIGRGPDAVQMLPWHHPAVELLQGQDGGLHPVVYGRWGSPWLLQLGQAAAGGAAAGAVAIIASAAGAGDEYVAALSTLAGIAGTAAASGAWPVAVAAALLFLVVLLICLFTGCGSDEHDVFENTGSPGNQSFALENAPEHSDPASHLVPAGAGPTQPSGTRTLRVKAVPHLLERNLYGLVAKNSDAKFSVVDDHELEDMLAWLGFAGGCGYPVERSFPGSADRPGSHWRNWFDIFLRKAQQAGEATALVTYFDS